MSNFADTPVDQLDFDSMYADELQDVVDHDERVTAREAAQAEIDSRNPPPEASAVNAPLPTRYEDQNVPEHVTPVDTHEVPLEDSIRDETTVLATDKFDNEGNKVQLDAEGNRVPS